MFGGKEFEELVKLFTDAVAGYEYMVRCERAFGESPVARQDYAILFKSPADDLVVVEGPVIQNVQPEKSHSLCEPSQHDIGDEFHGITFFAAKARRREENTEGNLLRKLKELFRKVFLSALASSRQT